jgi:hypothetical protein
MKRRRIRIGGLALLLLTALPPAARADVIDGDWCHSDGRRLSIKGPEIWTPSGSKATGNYSRHYFTYVVPAGEPAAGENVAMTLVNENLMQLRRGDAVASGTANSRAPETWRRCSATISSIASPRTIHF